MKKIRLLLLMITMFVTVNVKAFGLTIEKENSYGRLYDSMPTETQKGDIISIGVYLEDFQQNYENTTVHSLIERIYWDNSVFEIVENNDHFYSDVSEKVGSIYYDLGRRGSINYIIYLKDNVQINEKEKLFTIKFKVKNNSLDGIYEIYQENSYAEATENNSYTQLYVEPSVLKYLVGKPKLVFGYTPENVTNNDYIIGNYYFTHTQSEKYPGVLTTEYIMLAAKSIDGTEKDDMVIYTKTARGEWKNAVNNASITPPEKFNISYIDMNPYYVENGYYTDNTEKTIVKVLQLDTNTAIVEFEIAGKEKVSNIASIQNGIVSFSLHNKNYKFTISNDSLNVETNDPYFTTTTLQKRANSTINELFVEIFSDGSRMGGEYPVANEFNDSTFLKSSQSGKYVSDNYIIYFVRRNDENAMICIKQKNNDDCIFQRFTYYDGNDNNRTYHIDDDNSSYRIYFKDDNLIINEVDYDENYNEIIIPSSTIPFVGTYSKESSLSMVDAVKEFMIKDTSYYVNISDSDCVDYYCSRSEYFKYGTVLNGSHFTNPTRDGFEFVEWQKNGESYEITTPITEPMNLVAVFKPVHAAPVLSINSVSSNYEKTLKINSNSYKDGISGFVIDGYSIFEKGNDISLRDLDPQEEYYVVPNTDKTFIAKAFNVIAGKKYYTNPSNEVRINTVLPIPTLYKDTNYQNYVGGENNYYKYKLGISGIENFIVGDPNAEHVAYSIDGFTIYDKSNNSIIADEAINELAIVDVPGGQTRSFYAKLYVKYNNEKIYSEASEDIEIVTVSVPTLLSGHLNFANNQYNVPLYIDYDDNAKITGYILQRKLDRPGEEFSNYGSQHNPADSVNEFVTPGWRYIYRASAKYKDEQGNEYYSDYSNEIAIGYTQYETPSISLNENVEVVDGNYQLKINIDNLDSYYYTSSTNNNDKTLIIDGIDIYEGETLIDSNSISGDLVSGITISIPDTFSGTKQYRAKVYALNISGNKISSGNYSNIVEYSNDCPEGQFLANNTCHICPKGTFCPPHSTVAIACPANTTTLEEGSVSQDQCIASE